MVIVASGNISKPAWNPWDVGQSGLKPRHGSIFRKGPLGQPKYGWPSEFLDSLPDTVDFWGHDDTQSNAYGHHHNVLKGTRRVKSLWPNVDECNEYECGDCDCEICDLKDDDSVIHVEDLGHKPNSPWVPRLQLTNRDKDELMCGDMLSDKHIYAAQKLLSEQFPQIEGFQDTCLSQVSFNPIHAERIMQIHHTRGNHWVVSSWSNGDVVEVYDTLYDTLSPDLEAQLEAIYVDAPRDKHGRLYTDMPPIHKQKGLKDCGLFVVALAVELCRGFDVTEIRFRQWEMREHLYKCFENERLESFL